MRVPDRLSREYPEQEREEFIPEVLDVLPALRAAEVPGVVVQEPRPDDDVRLVIQDGID